MRLRLRHIGVGLVISILIAITALAQRNRYEPAEDGEGLGARRDAEFHFIRDAIHRSAAISPRMGLFASRDGQGSGWWIVDWPAADNHFTTGIQRLTRIDTGDPRHLRLTDDDLFDYPWIYATQTGWWGLSDAEIARLREYLDARRLPGG